MDQQPKPENNLSAYLYFVIFIILGSFFVLNLIVGVIIDKFSRMKQLYEDTGSTGIFLSTQQIDWLNTLKKAASKKPSKTAERPKVFLMLLFWCSCRGRWPVKVWKGVLFPSTEFFMKDLTQLTFSSTCAAYCNESLSLYF